MSDEASRRMLNLENTVTQILNGLEANRERIDLLEQIVLGDAELHLDGLHKRVEIVEKLLKELISERKSERDRLRGISIGLGLTGLTGASTLIAVLSQWANG